MGYRSEVRIATTREGYDLMCDRIDFISSGLNSHPLMGSERRPDFFEEEEGCVVFGWDNIDWCVGLFCDVTNVAEALGELDEQEIPYEFYSVGEDWDVIEFRTSGENEELALHIEPSVAIDVF